MNFEEFLIAKKIDPIRFKKGDQSTFEEWNKDYNLMHPDSFTQRKLFKINAIRREFQLKDSENSNEDKTKKTSIRPVIKPKIKR